MNVLSLFAGIGGFDYGLERAGLTVVGQVEIEPFCQRVLALRWPDLSREHRREDVRKFASASASNLAEGPSVDLLCGGFPCQDLSVAGKRAGLAGERSGLFWEIVRIAKLTRPTWGLFENVPGLISSHSGRDMWTVLNGLRECWPAVGYRILDSRYFGVAQRRRRVFFVCGPDEARVAQVLALSEGGEGNLEASGEAGADVAHWLAAGAGNRFGSGRDGQDDFVVGAIAFDTTQITSKLNRSNPKPGDPCHPLAAGAHAPAIAGSAVRRLTPVECERLQGFPDGWTCLCTPLDAYAADPESAALTCTCPDSPRYRALGNAVTTTVIEWLGRRLIVRVTVERL